MTGAVIQARMNSTRLPGKVLLPVCGRPLLSYLFAALQHCVGLEKILLATSRNRQDDPLAEWAKREGLACYRGSERDVLDRFYQTAREFKLDQIMRITGDCPLLQPDVCSRVLEAHLQGGADYTTTGETFADGLDCEVFSFDALKRCWKEARHPSEREHVTLYIPSHPERFRMVVVENEQDDGGFRLTVDEHADFEVVRQLIEALYDPLKGYVALDDIKDFLRKHPELSGMNRSIGRNEGLNKSLREESEAPGSDPDAVEVP